MWNETYHEIPDENLNWMLAGESKAHQELILEQVNKAKAEKKRNYFVELPNGDFYIVTNGIVQGSKNTR